MVYSVNSALVLDCRHFTYSPRRKTDRHRIALCCLSRHVNCVETIENFPVAQEGQLMEPTLLGKEGSGNDGLPRGACGGAQRDGCQMERDGVPLPLVDKPDSGPVNSESEHWAPILPASFEMQLKCQHPASSRNLVRLAARRCLARISHQGP